MNCLSEDQILLLADGGIAPNERGTLDRHIQGCARCRAELSVTEAMLADLEAGGDQLEVDAHVMQILARLPSTSGAAPLSASLRPSRNVARFTLLGTVSALAVAAGALLYVSRTDRGELAARGAGDRVGSTFSRDVGVRLYVGTTHLEPARPGTRISPDAAFSLAYSHLGKEEAHALVFALDSRGEVHWLFPGYETRDEDPSSIQLAPSLKEALLPTSVVLDRPAPGGLHVVALLTPSPLHVSAIEGQPAGELTDERIHARFPDASIETFDLTVESPNSP